MWTFDIIEMRQGTFFLPNGMGPCHHFGKAVSLIKPVIGRHPTIRTLNGSTRVWWSRDAIRR